MAVKPIKLEQMKTGDLIFTDHFSKTQYKDSAKIRVKEKLACVIVGQADKQHWNSERLAKVILVMGMFYADDLLAALGQEQYDKFAAWCTAKYVKEKSNLILPPEPEISKPN
jgi:hypothetical protein